MPRLVSKSLLSSCRQLQSGSSIATRQLSASAPSRAEGSQSSTPGWAGRHGEDHAVKREGYDAQSDNAQEAMKDRNKGKEGSQAISQKDEGSHNKRAEEDKPEAPKPVIGMNDERGGKGH